MSTAPGTRQVEVERLHVEWSLPHPPSADLQGRLERLASELSGSRLEDALTGGADPGEVVCLAQVETTPLTFDWARTDDELVTQWAQAIGEAAGSPAGRGVASVRYRSRFHATVDLVVSLLAGDHERAWAWALLGLDVPAAATPEDAVRRVLGRTAQADPARVTRLLVEVARRRVLEPFAACVGPGPLADASAAAWQAAGGDPGPADRPSTTASARVEPGAVAVRLASTVAERSAIWHEVGRLCAMSVRGEDQAGVGAPPPGAGHAFQVGALGPPLAELALLEVEPGMVRADCARAAAVLLVTRLASTGGARVTPEEPLPRRSTPTPPERPAPVAPAGRQPSPENRLHPHPLTPDAADPPATSGGASADERPAETYEPGPAPRLPVPSSPWGGLMFLLTLLHQDEFPIRVAEAPTTYGSSLRRALWRLAGALVASPAADTPPVLDDPALLAFCGLPADAEVPAGATAPQDDWLPREVARVLVALRAAMAVPEDRTDRAVLLRVIRRQARLRVEPGWIDVEYDLDDVDVEVRAAGLDLDPGFLPWLGAVVRFRYV